MAVFTRSDSEVISTVVQNSTVWAGVSPLSSPDRYDKFVKPNVNEYLNNLIKNNPYLANNPNIISSVKKTIENEFLKVRSKQSDPIEDDKKKQ